MPKKPRLPNVAPAKRVIAALEKAGACPERRSATSHGIYRRPLPDGTIATIVVTPDRREITRGTLQSILRQAHLSVEEFMRYYGTGAVMLASLARWLRWILPGASLRIQHLAL